MRIANAGANEATASIGFAVTLDEPATAQVTVDYATADGTATAGPDYTASSRTLTFAAGETSKTVSVAVLDAAHDEGEETMKLVLSNDSGARIRGGEAVGTIENSDPIPKAWLARFGRTVADNVVDAITVRLREAPKGGSHVTVGGWRLSPDGIGETAAGMPDEEQDAAEGCCTGAPTRSRPGVTRA